VVNLPGVASGELKLSADILAEIYLGTITRWNNEKISKLNSGVELPNREIIPIHTEDTSGTTWIFASYLRNNSKRWRDTYGAQRGIEWPVGVSASGNPQVARFVKQFKYTLSYIEFSQAIKNGLTWAEVSNHTGAFVRPSKESFKTSFRHIEGEGTANLQVIFGEGAGPRSWPITGASYILIKRQPQNLMRLRRTIEFFHWALHYGTDVFEDLHYVSIPEEFLPAIEEQWGDHIRCEGQFIWEPEQHRFSTPVKNQALDIQSDALDGAPQGSVTKENGHATPLLGDKSH
jgi:phosphate transport system substrate-binding protein